eukprot:2352439-Amphidinium_carterae.1
MAAGFDRRFLETLSGYEPNAMERIQPQSVGSPFSPAVREMQIQALEAPMREDYGDALSLSVSEIVPSLGGLRAQQFSLATPPFSRSNTPRTDPQLNWFAGALHASLRRQSEYRQEMLQQEESRAQDMLRFEQASAWVFQEGSAAVSHMDAIRDEAASELLAERLRMSNVEVSAQGELGKCSVHLVIRQVHPVSCSSNSLFRYCMLRHWKTR